ncbi:MAG: pyruvate kinase [Planctomycetes bacterium]|nr:pyruvate kinase [Planctomycetota bacterium]
MAQHRKVKIVATLGPSSRSPEVLKGMIAAGMDLARLNCSHSSHDDLEEMADLVRRCSRAVERPVGLMLDLSGPKLRTGKLDGGGPVQLEPDAELLLAPDVAAGDASRVGVSYESLADDVAVGERILLDDGRLELEVVEIRGRDVVARVIVGGPLGERKGLNLPGTQLGLPALTEKDKEDLAVGARLGVDYVALSFVQSPDDVLALRAELDRLGSDIPIIAKIERPQAVEQLEAILDVTEGVMVARGDLGVEAGSHRVPLIQKRILQEAGRRAVLDITATQMLESMIRSPRPTRAEASDVANAILDGTDAVMLSGETAVGNYPVEAVAMMDKIAMEVQEGVDHERFVPEDLILPDGPATAVARAAGHIAAAERYETIIALTGSGWTARMLAACAPNANIIALTPSEKAFGRLTLVRGVQPVFLPFTGGTDSILASGEAEIRRRGLLQPEEEVILVSGELDSWGVTHLLKIFTVRHDGEDIPETGLRRRVAMTQMLPVPKPEAEE